jgi:hypothetical protein
MLSIHLRLGLPSGLFPSGFPTNNLYTFLFSWEIKNGFHQHNINKNLINVVSWGGGIQRQHGDVISLLSSPFKERMYTVYLYMPVS